MLIHRLLYRSDAAIAGPPDAVDATVRAIVQASQLANQAAGLSGALMASSGVFVQVLEGPLNALEATFERICRDLRHKQVRLLEFAVADERRFEDWAMVPVAPTLELERLCPALMSAEKHRLDAVTAQSAMRLMHAQLPAPAHPDRSPFSTV